MTDSVSHVAFRFTFTQVLCELTQIPDAGLPCWIWNELKQTNKRTDFILLHWNQVNICTKLDKCAFNHSRKTQSRDWINDLRYLFMVFLCSFTPKFIQKKEKAVNISWEHNPYHTFLIQPWILEIKLGRTKTTSPQLCGTLSFRQAAGGIWGERKKKKKKTAGEEQIPKPKKHRNTVTERST